MKDEMENIPIKEKNATSKAKVFEILNDRTEESTTANLRTKSLPPPKCNTHFQYTLDDIGTYSNNV